MICEKKTKKLWTDRKNTEHGTYIICNRCACQEHRSLFLFTLISCKANKSKKYIIRAMVLILDSNSERVRT